MLSLIIVGARGTRRLERRHGPPLVYTPRGYRPAAGAPAKASARRAKASSGASS